MLYHQADAKPSVSGYQQNASYDSLFPMRERGNMMESGVGASSSNEVAPQQISGHQQVDNVIWKTEHTARRRLFFSIHGSLCDLEARDCHWVCTNEWAIQYRPHGSKRYAKRIGNVDKALIQAVFVRWIDNTLDKPIMLCSDELKGNCYSNKQGLRGLLTCPARKKLHFGRKGMRVYYADDTFNDPVMRQHGDLTEEDLECPLNRGFAPDGSEYKYFAVPRNHPIGWLIMRNSQKGRGTAAGYTVGRNTPKQSFHVPIDEEGCMRVSPEFFQMAYKAYKEKVINMVKFNKMRGLDLSIACPDGSFADNQYLEDFCDDNDAELAAVKSSCRNVTGEIEVVFRLAGHGLVGSAGAN